MVNEQHEPYEQSMVNEQHEPYEQSMVNAGALEGFVVPAPLVTPSLNATNVNRVCWTLAYVNK